MDKGSASAPLWRPGNQAASPILIALRRLGTAQSLLAGMFVAGLIMGTPQSRAADLATTNTHALVNFWAAIGSSNRPVTVVSFGDSMADSFRSPTYHLMNRLITRFGSAGYALNSYKNNALWNLENGATPRTPDSYWFTTYYVVPAGGAVWWANQPTPGGVFCNSVGVFYVTQTNGGAFRFMVSTNGGPWTTALTLQGYSSIPQGAFTNLHLPLNRYRARIESDSGTNYIIGPWTVATNTNGINAAFAELGGIALNQVTNVPRTIRDPIFAGLKPDLLIWHMKEPTDAGLSNRLNECEMWWQSAAPNCDVIYIGTTGVADDLSTTPGSYKTTNQNAIVRSIAVRHNRAYADLMNPTTGYSWLLANGFMQDAVHVNSAGGLHCANIMWDDLGFFALGLNRRITWQPNGNQLQLSYPTTTNARYRLEVSTNLQHWSAVFTNPMANATFVTNFATPFNPTYFRVGLTPP